VNPSSPFLLEPAFMKKVERLRLATRRLVRGSQAGGRRSRLTGSSLEFADYRPYSPGDDIRRVDWTAYARFRKWFLKTYFDERETDVRIYLDLSRSMRWDSEVKARRALELAGALGYLALCAGDRLSVIAFCRRTEAVLPPLMGRAAAPRLFGFLASLDFQGEGDLDEALSDPAALPRRRGLSVVISDGFSPSGGRKGLEALLRAGQEVHFLQIVSKADRDPEVSGDLRLIDCETDEAREVSVSSAVLRMYREIFREHVESLSRWCAQRGMVHLTFSAEDPLEEIVLNLLRRSGVIQSQRG
jgi:uncharacterized protein (DUF58 family)